MKVYKNFYILNVFYTDPGLLQGLIVKQICIYDSIFGFPISLSFPFWIKGFKRKQAKESHELYLKIKDYCDKEDFDNGLG